MNPGIPLGPAPLEQEAIAILVAATVLALGLVHVPLVVRLVRVALLERALRIAFDHDGRGALLRQEMGNAFARSPLADQWSEFVEGWRSAAAATREGDAEDDVTSPALTQAPVRFGDVLDQHPILPAGARRTLLPAVPALLLAAGVAGAFAGLVLALPHLASAIDPAAAGSRAERIADVLTPLGMALRVGFASLLLSLVATLLARFIVGRAEAQAEALDAWAQLGFPAISPAEVAARDVRRQSEAIEALRIEVRDLARRAGGSSAGAMVSTRGDEPLGSSPEALVEAAGVVAEAGVQLRDGVRDLGELARELRTATEALKETSERLADTRASGARDLERALGEARDSVATSVSKPLDELAERAGALEQGVSGLRDELSGEADRLRNAADAVIERLGVVSQALAASAGRTFAPEPADTRSSGSGSAGSEASPVRAIDHLGDDLLDEESPLVAAQLAGQAREAREALRSNAVAAAPVSEESGEGDAATEPDEDTIPWMKAPVLSAERDASDSDPASREDASAARRPQSLASLLTRPDQVRGPDADSRGAGAAPEDDAEAQDGDATDEAEPDRGRGAGRRRFFGRPG